MADWIADSPHPTTRSAVEIRRIVDAAVAKEIPRLVQHLKDTGLTTDEIEDHLGPALSDASCTGMGAR